MLSRYGTKLPNRLHGLFTILSPYLESKSIYDLYHWDYDWNASINKEATEQNIGFLFCPSAPGGRKWITDYATCGGIEVNSQMRSLVSQGLVKRREIKDNHWWGMFNVEEPSRKHSEVLDGLSQTFMFFECGGRPFYYEEGEHTPGVVNTNSRWANPLAEIGINDFCKGNCVINCNNWEEVYAFHPGGANFCYGDGSVHFHLQDMDIDAFISLLTHNAGD